VGCSDKETIVTEYVPTTEDALRELRYAATHFDAMMPPEGFNAALAAHDAEVLRPFRDELATQGLPETATLADLIRHHRGNAAAAAAFDSLAQQQPKGKWVFDGDVDVWVPEQ
jgi:hypothetical protein